MLPAEQRKPKIARRREQWKKYQARLDPGRLVFVDETWAKTNMAPLRGWAPVGQRLHHKVPYGHWKTMTFIAALRYDRIDAPFVFDQPINAASFTAWVEQQLCPTLATGDIVILDNLSSHKRPCVRQAIRARGVCLLFLLRILIPMVSNVILYSIPPQTASAVSSARGSLGRSSMNGQWRNTIGR